MVNLKGLFFVLSFIAKICAEVEFCEFFETKNISSGQKFENGTILFDGVYYPDGYYRSYNYIRDNEDKTQVPSEAHIRGCLCKFMTCVRLCPHSDDYTGLIVVHRENETDDEINLNNFGIIRSWPDYDDSDEYLTLLDGNVTWNISKVFKSIYLFETILVQ
jgi:hypothetical protein